MQLSAKIYNHFPALSHRDFRLFWLGQCVSLIGTWMQNVGQSWLVYQLTDSSFLLGMITVLQFTPMLLFSLPIGAFIDRYERKKILFIVQFLMMMTAFTLAFLVWAGIAAYWNIAILAFFLGVLNCIDMPVRQSFMVYLTSKEHLMNAIALNSTIFNAARIIGPSIAGLVFGYMGASVCFLINGISFIPVLIGIYLIKEKGLNPNASKSGNLLKEIKEGLTYIRHNAVINTTIMMVTLANTIMTNFNILIPVMAKTVFGGDAKIYGYLMTALGCGAFLGAFSLAASNKGVRIRLLMGSFLALSFFVFIQGFQTQFVLAFLFFILAGFSMTTALSLSNTTMQLNSPDNLRGRIMSVYSLVLGGAAPLGGLYSGILCEKFGVSATFKISGFLGILCILAIILLRYKKVTQKMKEDKIEAMNG